MAAFPLSKGKASSKSSRRHVFRSLFPEVSFRQRATQRVETWGCATRSARPSAPIPTPEASRLAGSERDLPDALCSEHCRNSGPQIALQHDRGALHGTTAAKRLLELAAPRLEGGCWEVELLHDRHFFSAASLALEPHDRTRRTFRRSGRVFPFGHTRTYRKSITHLL